MKKRILLISFVVVMIVSMVAFSSCSQSTPSPSPSPSSSPAPAPAPAAKVFKYKMVTFLPRPNKDVDLIVQFTKDVKEATNGQIEIELFAGGELMPTLEVWEALSKGVVQIFHSYGPYWVGKTQLAGISSGLPYTTGGTADYDACFYWRGMGDIFKAEYEKFNFNFLQILSMAEETTLWMNKPFKTLADVQGKKIRATGLLADVMTEAGLSCVMLPMPEIYGALETGVIDGKLCGSTGGDYPLKFHTVAKYQLYPAVMSPLNTELLVNLDTWKAMPADLQETFKACVGKWKSRQLGYGQNRDVTLQAKVEAEDGVKRVYFSDSDVKTLREAAWRVYDRKAKEDAAFGKAWGIMKDYLILKNQ